MRLWITTVLILGVVGLVVLALVNRETPPDLPPIEAVEVEVTSGEVTFRGKTVRPGEIVTTNDDGQSTRVTVSGTPTEATASTPEPPVLSPDLLSIRVVDAAGFSIPNATVTVADRAYRITDGQLILPDLAHGTHLLQVDADDYEPNSATIQSPTDSEATVTLEYQISFELQVIECSDTEEPRAKQTGPPLADATVYLWEGPAVQRPVSDRLTLPLGQETWLGESRLSLRLASRGVTIERIEGLMKPGHLKAGDRLARLTARTGPSHTGGLSEQPLRMWDSITALIGYDGIWNSWEQATGERGTAEPIFEFSKKEPWTCGKLITQSVTDADGRCRFGNLPARLYVVMVEKGELQSRRAPILPVVRRGQIEIVSWRSNSVRVTAQGSSVDPTIKWGPKSGRPRVIQGANILMRKEGGSSTFTGKTNAKGVYAFSAIPWGDYTLTVTPSVGTDATPNSRTRKVQIERQHHDFTVFFDVNEREGFRVSGTVLDVKTGDPVPEHPMQLGWTHPDNERWRKRLERSGRTRSWRPYAQTFTDDDGRFEFYPVEAREYKLEPSRWWADPYTGFLPLSRRVAKEAGIEYDEHIFFVVDEDIEDIEYYVMRDVRTRFLGRVVDEDGHPLEGIAVNYEGEVNIERGRSDEEGRFEVSVALPPHELEHKGTLKATLPAPTVRHEQRTWNGIPFQGTVWGPGDRTGYASVAYLTGDTVRDIQIVLEGDGQALEGTIRTLDGEVPEFVELCMVSARQNSRSFYATITPDGSYRIIKLQPGEFSLIFFYFDPRGVENEAMLTIMRKALDYLPCSHKLVMPEDRETLRLDIVTEKTSYLGGKVIDRAEEPVEGLLVLATATQKNDTFSDGSAAVPSPEGEFLIRRISPARTYTIEVWDGNREKMFVQIEGLTPPTDNIILVMDSSKAEQE